MFDTAVLQHPKDGFSQFETQAFLGPWKSVVAWGPQPTPEITRVQSLQANVGKMGQIFARDQHDLPETLAVDSPLLHKDQLFRDLLVRQTAASPARATLISWLLDLNAWGDATEQLKVSVKELLTLRRGWDGYDAEPIDPISAEYACAFIDVLGERSKDFEPFADPNGIVGLEAHKQDSAAYLSFPNDGLIAYMFRVGGAIHRGNRASVDTVKRVLNAVF